ncbi:MAG: hypothetical protein V2J55_16105 [Candidatus Competibacteraceae bacterium]|jgi:hypothetical protein|nr:hypothetical protein [Candidatus Competibacteraceae bacterium]
MAVGLQLFGLIMEIAGVLLMANIYTGMVPLRQLLFILVSALFRGAEATGAVEVAHLRLENKIAAFQGLALVGFGFVLQAVGVMLAQLSAMCY